MSFHNCAIKNTVKYDNYCFYIGNLHRLFYNRNHEIAQTIICCPKKTFIEKRPMI